MISLNVDWIDTCPLCSSKVLKVRTSGDYENLNSNDQVVCSCGNTGYVDIHSNNAFVCWDELSELELKYNELKIMYDSAIFCLMESNYGDVKYLKGCGAIK